MILPSSAADKPDVVERKKGEEKNDIIALVKGEKMEFSKTEALALASRLLIAVEVELNAEKI